MLSSITEDLHALTYRWAYVSTLTWLSSARYTIIKVLHVVFYRCSTEYGMWVDAVENKVERERAR